MRKRTGRYDTRYIQIGLKVAYYRKLKGYSQEQLADRLDINVKYLSQVESPSTIRSISLELLFALADEFHIPPSKLLDDEL